VSHGDGDPRRRGGAAASTLLVLSGLLLVLALAYPGIRRAAFHRRVEVVARSVDALRTAAEQYRRLRGTWPPTSPPGQAPPDLASLIGRDISLRGPDYRVGWNRWGVVVRAPRPTAADSSEATSTPEGPAPGTLPGITVRSGESSLLAALLDRYGRATSFARDSSWTLVVGPAEPAPARADTLANATR